MQHIKQLLKAIFIIASVLLFSCPCFAQNTKDTHFAVSIFQHGEMLPIANRTVKVKKEEFKIVFTFADDKPMNICINASFSPKNYNAAIKGVPLDELSCFKPGSGMAEGVFNGDRSISIADDAVNYWFYEDSDFHRFDVAETSEGRLLATRTISKLWNKETKDNIDLNTIKTPLYLVFATSMYINSKDIEIQRECLKIEWINAGKGNIGKNDETSFLNPNADGWDTDVINYRSIRQNIANPASNFYYPKLWERFLQGDSTFTQEESRHLYYGYVFHKNYLPFNSKYADFITHPIRNKENPTKKEWEAFLSFLDDGLKHEPFNCSYMYCQMWHTVH